MRDVAAGLLLDFLDDGGAVGVVAEPHDGDENQVLKLTQCVTSHPIAPFADLLNFADFRIVLNFDEFSKRARRCTELTGETPEQWTISWTTFQDVYEKAQPLLGGWAATLTDVPTAEAEFWPTFATYGVGYNLLVLQKLTRGTYRTVRRKLGRAWTDDYSRLLDQGRLYAIDMSIFEAVRPNKVDGFERFTPASITLLEQDPDTKALKPVLIRIAGAKGAGAQNYTAATATASA